MISVLYWPSVFSDYLYLVKRLLWASFPLSMDTCFAGAHSETWTMSLLWATLNLFSLSHIFSHSENVLLFPNLPSKIMIEGHEFLHCCSFPAASVSFTVDPEKALSFFLYIAYLFYLHSCSHPSCSISPWFLLIPRSLVSSDSLAPLMHPLYQFSRTGEWTTPNLSLLPKVTAYLFIYFLKGTQFFVDHPFSNPCFPPSPLQSSGFNKVTRPCCYGLNCVPPHQIHLLKP